MKRINVLKLSYVTAILSCVAALATSTYTKDAEGCSGGNGAWLGVDIPDVAPTNVVLSFHVDYVEVSPSEIANSPPSVTLTNSSTAEVISGHVSHIESLSYPPPYTGRAVYNWIFVPDVVLDPNTPYHYTVTFSNPIFEFSELGTEGDFTTSGELLSKQQVNATVEQVRLQGREAPGKTFGCSDDAACAYSSFPEKETFVPKMQLQIPALGEQYLGQINLKIVPPGADAVLLDGALAATGFSYSVLLEGVAVEQDACVSVQMVMRDSGEESEPVSVCAAIPSCPEMDSVRVDILQNDCGSLDDSEQLPYWCFFHPERSECQGVTAIDPTPQCASSNPTGGSGGSPTGSGGSPVESGGTGGSGGSAGEGNPQVKPVSATAAEPSEGCALTPQTSSCVGWLSWLMLLASLALKKRRVTRG